MGLENPTGATIATFDPTWPTDGDPKNQGDDHLRLIKAVLKSILPGIGGNGFATPISATEAELNFVSGVTSAIQTQINNAVASIQNAAIQTNVAFATTGGAGAYALTTTPVIALSVNLRYRISFSAVSTGTDTLSVNSSTPKLIKQYAPNGSLVAAIITVGMLADVEYNGTYWVILNQLPTTSAGYIAEDVIVLNSAETYSDSRAIGINQTWQNVVVSRASGVTYTNSTTSPIMAAISANSLSGASIAVVVDGIAVVTAFDNTGQNKPSVTFIVPPGLTYSATIGNSGTLNTWTELRL